MPSLGGLNRHRPYMDYTRNQRPSSTRQPRQQVAPVVMRASNNWGTLPEVTIRLSGLLPNETTWNIWRNFSRQGTIIFIELYEGTDGTRDGGGKIKFSPPPKDFWTTGNPRGQYAMMCEDEKTRYNINVELRGNDQRYNNRIQGPVIMSVSYAQKMTLFASRLHFGLMVKPKLMMQLQAVEPIFHQKDLSFEVDLLRKRITAEFLVNFQDPRELGFTDFQSNAKVGYYNRTNRYKFQIPFDQLKVIQRVESGNGSFKLIISLDSPPQFHRRREDEKPCLSEGLTWSEFEDNWLRQTDIVYDPYTLDRASSLRKERPFIDIGRWTTYAFDIPSCPEFPTVKQALQDFNIEIAPLDILDTLPGQQAELWSFIDPPKQQETAGYLQQLDSTSNVFSLPFEVRYQLEVCISRELLNEYNVTRDFIAKLAEISLTDATQAKHILEYIAEGCKRIYDPMSVFENPEALGFSSKTEIPHYCAYARKATITPSTIIFSCPTVETTNRVLRHYARENAEGRFLRCQFTDEIFEGRINSCVKQRNDELFTRVYRTLSYGIQIGDRHYEFLAFGNSQFRENGAYFFCPTDYLSCNDIRAWMGNFSHINVVARYAARLGQCFSTTRAINGLRAPEIVKIPDIEANGYTFTDGVGKISPQLAQMIASELGLRGEYPPSAFQFRLGGCKGILVVWEDATRFQVHIRKSQQKFTAVYNGLEIIRCSKCLCASLNRQTITILSALGVADKVFLDMMTDQLEKYQNAMNNNELAMQMLLRYIDDNQMTINIANMIRNGFMAEGDPFVMSLLHLWRAWSIKLLKEKAKIMVEKGAYVLGCVDETKTLRGYVEPKVSPGEVISVDELPQIFIQIPGKDKNYTVIQGICLVGRNPSLHPGDLRVVQAVDVQALHHIRDVVVFPACGERDIPQMCSGGDLDGDDYFVIWDPELQPPEWNCKPMSYTPPAPKAHDKPVEVEDLMKFMCRYMKNDSLPTIAHAHLANADRLDGGVKHADCIELARLHSKAVDYVKTGLAAEMPKRLRPRKWPHFMEKKHKPKDAIYRSNSILGQLYDKVETVDFKPQYEFAFDKRVLRAYKLDDVLLKKVRQIKSKYDTAMRRIMAQHEIKTEFEVWSSFVLSKPRVGTDYKVQEEMGRISDALKEQFRGVCIKAAVSKDFASLGPFVAAMYKVTKEEMDIALAECRSTMVVGGREVPKRKMEPRYMPLITFPWLFEKELGRIATGFEGSYDELDLSEIERKSVQPRKHKGAIEVNAEDYIKNDDGTVVHRGEVLDVFPQENYSNDGDPEEDINISSSYLLVDIDSNNSCGSDRRVSPSRSCLLDMDDDYVEFLDTPFDSPMSTANNSFPVPADNPNAAPDHATAEPSTQDDTEVEQAREEEVIVLDLDDSPLEKLAHMHAS